MVEAFVLDGQQARLTQAALETLAVVAYKQPVSRARVSAIRGVNVDGVMRTLLTRGLVEEAGQDHSTGAPPLPHHDATSWSGSASPRSTSCPSSRRTCPTWTTSTTSRTSWWAAGRGPTARPSAAGSEPGDDVSGPDLERDDDGLVRLQKLLAQSGVASPAQVRGADAGRRRSRSTARSSPGSAPRSTRRTAVIRVDGQRLPPVSPHVYLVLNKPRGVVSTMSDPQGRRTLVRPRRRPARAAVPRRPARHRHRGADPAHQRRRLRPARWRTRRTRWTRRTSPRSTAWSPSATARSAAGGVTLDDGPVAVSAAQGSSVDGARGPLDRRAGDPRGPQPDRPAAARPGRPPGAPADPHRDRPGRSSRGLGHRASCASSTSDELGALLDARPALSAGRPVRVVARGSQGGARSDPARRRRARAHARAGRRDGHST